MIDNYIQPIRQLISKLYIAGNTVGAVRDTIQGLFENIARSVLEGVSYEFLLGLEAFKGKGFEAKVITLTGGGANSGFWRQMLCDMLACSVRVTKEKEAAAFGAILQAIWLIGDKTLSEVVNEHLVFDETKACNPNLINSEAYQKAYKKWKSY